MHFDVFTLLPGVFAPYLQESILGRAQAAGLLKVAVHNIRDYATDRHHITDDVPYGGGGGMVMKPEPIFAAVEAVLGAPPQVPVILLTPQGRVFTQAVAGELAQHEHLALLCGRYEGVDERVRLHLATDEISVGDYVLTGGELPALAIIDAVARLIPGALGARWAAEDDSHATGLLEYPQYTRPPVFRGWSVPDVLLSGHHAQIERWRRRQALERTLLRRPDMLATADLTGQDKQDLAVLAAGAQTRRSQEQFAAHAQAYVTSPTHAAGASLGRVVELTAPQETWRVLDTATGAGHMALALATYVAHVVAADVTVPMLAAARTFLQGRGAENVSLCQAEAGDLPFADAMFDLITCRIALHHFPDAQAAFREWARVLRPGGLLALVDNVVPADPQAAAFVNAFEKRRDPSHQEAYSIDRLEDYCRLAGLQVVHAETLSKAMDFAQWAQRMGHDAAAQAALWAMLEEAPAAAQEVLRPRSEGPRRMFDLHEGLVLARPQPAH